MIHDSGQKRASQQDEAAFPEARVVVSGTRTSLARGRGRLLLLNPGSPTDRRRQPEHTFALRGQRTPKCGRRCWLWSRPTEGGKSLDYNCACGGGRAQEIRQQSSRRGGRTSHGGAAAGAKRRCGAGNHYDCGVLGYMVFEGWSFTDAFT